MQKEATLRRGRVRRLVQQSSKCPICFSKFQDQVLGSPDNCDHMFCLDCIIKWAKNNKECPVDRAPFEDIRISHKGLQLCETNVSVHKKKRTMPERYDFTTFCEVCSSFDRCQLNHCKSCNLGFHTYCLRPGSRPKQQNEEWYCPDCNAILKKDKPKFLTKAENLQLKQENTWVSQDHESSSRTTPTTSVSNRSSYSEETEVSKEDLDAPQHDDDISENVHHKASLNHLLVSKLHKSRIFFSDAGRLFYDMTDIKTDLPIISENAS